MVKSAMVQFEYKVVPAPTRGQKSKGVKAPEARFALAMESALNELASDGWDYLRADTLPSEERQGLTGTTTTYRNVLIFRREVQPTQPEMHDTPPALLEAPADAHTPVGASAQDQADTSEPTAAAEDETRPSSSPADTADQVSDSSNARA